MKQTYSKMYVHDVCSKLASCLLHRLNRVLIKAREFRSAQFSHVALYAP